jgi:hypothetical protein
MALLLALFIIIILAILAGTMVSAVDLHGKSTRNGSETAQVQQVAEAGLTHGLGLFYVQVSDDPFNEILLGQNGTWDNGAGDDGILEGSRLEIPAADAIPSAGVVLNGYRYQVRVTDDPADDATPSTDSNQRVLITCTATAEGGSGPSAEARAIVERTNSDYRVMLDGPMTFSQPMKMSASCARGYLNGAVTYSTSQESKAGGGWFHPAGITLSTKFTDTRTQVAAATIPSMAPSSLCSSYTPAPGGTVALSGSGVRCYSGNVTVSGPNGGVNVTVVSTGSITVTAGRIDHATLASGAKISLVAAEDILLSGNAEFRGAIYCGGQISMQGSSSGNGGAIYCRGLALGAVVTGSHVINSSSSNSMAGGCGSTSTATIGSWRFSTWYPGMGS